MKALILKLVAKFLIWLGYIVMQPKTVIKFVPEVNYKNMHSVLSSDEFKYFIDECEREARSIVGSTEKERLERSYIYSGVLFVAERASKYASTLSEAKTAIEDNFGLGLDDRTLLKEYHGKNNKSKAA